ncbi:MAG TPA: MBG domain-containing protein, partial [Pyrinomonadaceae bacterium]|nr:MBG domain-containing protein [Pyrinomonadaceae bacterium]
MTAPASPTSRFRLSSNKKFRIAFLAGLVVAAVSVFCATNSFAGSITQRLFAGAASMMGGATSAHAKSTSHSATFEFAAAAPTQSSTMAVERRGHTATRLSDGRVLIAGGENSSGALNQSEIYDPASATFSPAGNMGAARIDHSATLLADGRVLIAGGRNGGGSLDTTEIFDPAAGAFTNGPSMSVARAGHSTTLFANGRVFIAGGEAGGSAEILDLGAGTSAPAGHMGVARSMHSAALLQDGRVLVVGGRDANGNELSSGEVFDTAASAFSTVDNTLKVSRVRAHLRVLFDGKVQIIGGNNDGSMEIYDPAISGFGGYAHVLPESDPCTGLAGQILASQTRAALFHIGHADPLFDRSGHTITELNGQALVLGGVNGSGGVLSSGSVVASSAASITTDKIDYSPGQIATIRGRGFQPGEVVRVKIHEDPHTPQERGFDATADADGNFSGEYLVQVYDIDMKFIVGARGLTSGATAQTTFTDSNPQLITVAAPTSATVIQGATANYGTVTLVVGGNTNPCSVTFGVTPALPAGVTAVFGTNPVSTTGANVTTTLSVTTTGATPTGTYTFQVTGTNSGVGCQGPGPTPSTTLTLIVNSATVNTTTTVANATATYGDTSVTLNATVTPASGPAVNNGSVTFTVKQGLTTIGAATTDNTVVAGAASVSYSLPAGTDAGPYTIEASYTPGSGFNASSGTGTLTINKRAITITADPQTKVYGNADPSLTYQITSGSLAFSDTIVGTLVRAAGENVGTYAITQGTLAISDGNGGNNYNLTFVGANLTITARPITITADPKSKTYGDADPVLTYQITSGSLAFSDTIVGALTRAAGQNVGTYAITQGTLAISDGNGGNNYNLTFVGANLTITARPITITADPKSKTYGDADPSLTYQITSGSLAFSDTIVGALVRAPGENVGSYAITQGTLAISDGNGGNNYNLTFVGANLTITARPITITADPKSKTYGDADPALTYQITSGSLAFSDTIVGALTRAAGQNVGTYAITQGTLAISDGNGGNNYNLTFVGANLTITARPITITADPQTKVYGNADPSFTYQITSGSLAFSDTIVGALVRAPGENVGSYAI